MYAIIQTGGKQFKVEKGSTLSIDKIEQEPGSQVQFSEVLLVGDEEGKSKLGQPFVQDGKVSAKILRHLRAPKVLVFKKRSKKGYKKLQGHRQNLTEIQVEEISA